MSKKIAIINGPNLNILGAREPAVYGNQSFEEYLEILKSNFPNIEILYFQNNIEGEIINYLQSCRKQNIDGIIINPAAYTHTSIAIADTLVAIAIPTIEVHISNVLAREDFRKTSYISAKCIGSISGLGLEGYQLALSYLIKMQNAR